jgi:hypothetical protein
MLAITNLNLKNYSCIYSTLVLFVQQTGQLNMQTAHATFDQPVWIKAVDIKTQTQNAVCRTADFYILMRFIDSLGYFMGHSGL